MTTRNLQITIFEAPPETGRGGRSGGSRGPGFDPEDNYVKPPPEDPEDNYVKPPPEDPEDNYVKPPPEDPGAPWPTGFGGFGGHPASGNQPAWVAAQYLPSTAAPGHGCCCSPCSCDESKTPERPCISSGDYSGFLIVRVTPGTGPLTVDSLWELAEAAGLEGLKAVLAAPLVEGEDTGSGAGERRGGGGVGALRRWLGELEPPKEGVPAPPEPKGALVSRPLVQLRCRDRRSTVETIEGFEALASHTAFRPLHSLARYWRVDLRPYPDLVADVLDRFNELPEVDLAYRELRAIDTYGPTASAGGGLAGDQAYFDPAPVGIGAAWLRDHLAHLATQAGQASLLTVIDLEQGWTVDHLELAPVLPKSDLLVHGENREADEVGAGNHGTAVLGQLAAAGVGTLGVKGSATDVAAFRLASHYRHKQAKATLENPFPGTNGHVASAIFNCLIGPNNVPSPLGMGDVLLLEVQRARLPTETDEADFDAIRLATALGIVVVEAAGNGNHDLDRCGDPQTGRTLQRGAGGFVDSGAILVGASFADLPHDRAPFSNYGSRLDCYGWGEGVTTCGYGDLHDGGGKRTEYYTNTFNGTSSAAPIIAGAAALLQALHVLAAQDRLLPLPMRALLASRATGTAQGPNVGGHIGVMPDLHAIARGTLQIVPDLYARRAPGDDGSRPGPRDPISSSPDIVHLDPTQEGKPLGEKSASAHHPAPGSAGITGGQLHVRLRNRGSAHGRAEVLLYAAPTATLIGPDAWESVGAVTLANVAPGDRLRVSDPVPWQPTASFPAAAIADLWPPDALRAYSYLAVFDPDGAAAPHPIRALPPGGRYFDWRRYREFLRGPGVAWRNVHPVAPAHQAKLAFLLTGTPDRSRELDLEVIQRLPEKATVKLHLPPALASKLHQRQPGLAHEDNPTTGSLTLPRRRSTRFSRLRMPCGLSAPARLDVAVGTGTGSLEEGHSLAIRQLWRGEEVGRITWYVTDGKP